MGINKKKRGNLMLGSFTLRVTPEMFEWVKARARSNNESINGQINDLLEHARHSVEQSVASGERQVM